jgi:uncharacterized membrane protein
MDALATSWIVRLLGRFHPTTIHFPIAFLLAAATLEVLRIVRKKPLFPETLFFCLTVGAAGALVSAPLGWADAASLRFGEEDAVALAVHRWLGTFTAAASAGAWVLLWGQRRGKLLGLGGLFRAALFASALAVGIGAHFGGILVYGHDYYSSALESGEAPSRGAGSAESGPTPEPLFARDVLPLFVRHCARCHGPRKQNGRLRLDSRDAVLQGGKSGPAALPRDSSHSLIYRAITDPNADTRMPQEAPPLPRKDIDLVKRWIDQGAR